MKYLLLSLLPKKLNDRDALNHESLNIKPRLPKGFQRLNYIHKFALISLLVLALLGYHPAVAFPPLRQNTALAQEQQKQEIVSSILPPISLPHPGYLSTRFSRWHPGVDIATGLGMPIHPIAEGLVEEVNFGFLGYGNYVVVSHQANLKSLYAHMGKIYVKKNAQVTIDDVLGTVGMSGFTSGPHTHLELTKDGKIINPTTILPKLQDYPSTEYLKPYGGGVKENNGTEEKGTSHKILRPDFS